jgi:NADH-quinone oxidoreductase subunit L
MNGILHYLWLIPALPLLAAGILALTKQPHRRFAATLAIGAMAISFGLSLAAFAATLHTGEGGEGVSRGFQNFSWFQFGDTGVRIGWVLDPLTACMLVMVTFVGSLIFIYSQGYMAHDENFTRFFCFLSLFAAAMLGLVIANSLLLLFICWELVGLSSYLLIGFWYHKSSAAAAAKKAFIVTRIGDIGFFIGMLWLYAQTGTLLFYDDGKGCLEAAALTKLVTQVTIGGMALSTVISLLIFCGAVGKSGQVPLHVWLPDAMEGPTPVSALIHAATMVAAGVFLVARVYPLMAGDATGVAAKSTALTVVTWVGAITALFAASIALAQFDIKRILAYSTVSQLGFMMMGIGVGGYAVGMLHLITHAFFKALLFLGAGSVIHGCHEEQDIRAMGGLRKWMPVTFATYAVGMMALSGVPLFFSGFWSKDEILHSAMAWQPSRWPFYFGIAGAFLTAFYMTRQIWYVFFGHYRGEVGAEHPGPQHSGHHAAQPHESPPVMTVPLIILAGFAILLSVVATPVWPWFHAYLNGHLAHLHVSWAISSEVLATLLLSSCIVAAGIGLAWWLYAREPVERVKEADPLERVQPQVFSILRDKFLVDELYDATFVRLNAACARASSWLDQFVWGGLVQMVAYVTFGLSWLNRLVDEFVVNLGFDKGCGSLRGSGSFLARIQNGQVQRYLRIIGLGLAAFALLFIWGCK